MCRRLAGLALVAEAFLLGCGCAGSTGSAVRSAPRNGVEGAPLGSGTQATDFAARDIEGKTVRLSDYLGKQPVLLDFWSTFCEPCLAEMPHLRRLYEANKARGLVVLGIAMDGPETVADVPSFAKRNGLTFPVLFDEDSHIVSIYNPKRSAPLSVLIDREGRVVRVREGYNPGDETLVAEDVARVLASPAAPPAASAAP